MEIWRPTLGQPRPKIKPKVPEPIKVPTPPLSLETLLDRIVRIEQRLDKIEASLKKSGILVE
ncbi:MAG: hypothetical protein HY929_04725 [Euryarchaeota archaeon]|nr:hypothetical protein [Euryarchaeota archaeon]